MARFFPKISISEVTAITAAATFLQDDPDYLSDINCSYGQNVKSMVRKVAGSAGISEINDDVDEVVGAVVNFANDPATMETEVSAIYGRVKKVITELSSQGGDKDAVSMLTNAVKLLEKLTVLAEVNAGHKRFLDFKSVVLEVLEEILDGEQRTKFVNRLGTHLS